MSNAHHLVLLAGHERNFRRADLGPEAIGHGIMGSGDLLLAFLKHFPDAANRLATDIGTEVGRLSECLLELGDTKEEPASPSATLIETMKEIGGEVPKPHFSAAVRQAIRLTRQEEKAFGKDPGPNFLLATLLASDCEARQVLLNLGGSERLDYALQRLRSFQPDAVDFAELTKKQSNALMEAMWPRLLQDEKDRRIAKYGKDPIAEGREKRYAENPGRYEKSIDIAEELNRDHEGAPLERYALGIYLLAAGNEARIRRAPYVTTDHMLYAALQPVTETWKYLQGHGVNPEDLRRRIDEDLPRFEDGPRWPDNSRGLTFNIPPPTRIKLKKEIPEGLDPESLSEEQRDEYFEKQRNDEKFTDLVWLRAAIHDESSFSQGILKEAGITEDEVEAEIKAIRTGNREWFLVPPNLPERLRNPEPHFLGRGHLVAEAVEVAAQFEARKRWAPSVTIEHILLALLVDGTDTSDLLDDLSIDRAEMARRLDAFLPRFASGPYFPKLERMLSLFKIAHHCENKASDLKFVEDLLDSPSFAGRDSFAAELIAESGVTLEAVQDRLRALGVNVGRGESRRTT